MKLTGIELIELHIPLDYEGTITLEVEIELFSEDFAREDVLALIAKAHFDEWLDSVINGIHSDWDITSFVKAWQKDNASAHRKIDIYADGKDPDGKNFCNNNPCIQHRHQDFS